MATEAAEAQPSTSAAADKYVEFHVSNCVKEQNQRHVQHDKFCNDRKFTAGHTNFPDSQFLQTRHELCHNTESRLFRIFV